MSLSKQGGIFIEAFVFLSFLHKTMDKPKHYQPGKVGLFIKLKLTRRFAGLCFDNFIKKNLMWWICSLVGNKENTLAGEIHITHIFLYPLSPKIRFSFGLLCLGVSSSWISFFYIVSLLSPCYYMTVSHSSFFFFSHVSRFRAHAVIPIYSSFY